MNPCILVGGFLGGGGCGGWAEGGVGGEGCKADVITDVLSLEHNVSVVSGEESLIVTIVSDVLLISGVEGMDEDIEIVAVVDVVIEEEMVDVDDEEEAEGIWADGGAVAGDAVLVITLFSGHPFSSEDDELDCRSDVSLDSNLKLEDEQLPNNSCLLVTVAAMREESRAIGETLWRATRFVEGLPRKSVGSGMRRLKKSNPKLFLFSINELLVRVDDGFA